MCYDYAGRRTKKVTTDALGEVGSETTVYCYDGPRVIAEYDGEGTLLRKFIYGPGIDEVVCMIDVSDNDKVYWYHYDGLGSVVALSKDNGEVVERYTYTAFGGVTILSPSDEPRETSDVNNPYMYTGRRLDEETGLFYYRARYYHPTIGRFMSPDPLGLEAGLNLYAYVRNNSVNLTDPTGLQAPAMIYDPISGRSWEPAPSSGYWGGWVDNAAMFYLWASGEGPDTLLFGPRSRQVDFMKKAPGVERARKEFEKAREKDTKLKEFHTADDFGLPGLLGSGLNPTRQFVGSYYIDMYANPDGTMTVCLRNRTSMTSFLYGIGPSWPNGPFGDMWQEYWWIEYMP